MVNIDKRGDLSGDTILIEKRGSRERLRCVPMIVLYIPGSLLLIVKISSRPLAINHGLALNRYLLRQIRDLPCLPQPRPLLPLMMESATL